MTRWRPNDLLTDRIDPSPLWMWIRILIMEPRYGIVVADGTCSMVHGQSCQMPLRLHLRLFLKPARS